MKSHQAKPGPHIGASLKRESGSEPRRKFRCNTTGGEWHNARKYPDWDVSEIEREIVNVIENLPDEDSQMWAYAQLNDLISGAEEGSLSIDPPEDFKEVVHYSPLLELRIQVNPDAVRAEDRHLLRLYFVEPESYPRLLLGLSFAKKPSGSDPGGKQDRHMREAKRRFTEGMSDGHTWGITVPVC